MEFKGNLVANQSTILGFINRKQWAEAKSNREEQQNNATAHGCRESVLWRPEECQELGLLENRARRWLDYVYIHLSVGIYAHMLWMRENNG